MTNREFYTAIITAEVSDELTAFAQDAIAKLNARNEKRSSKPSKASIVNAPIKAAIIEFIGDRENVTAADVAVGVDITVQKASALLRQLVADEKVTVTEVKVPKKGKCKGYTLA